MTGDRPRVLITRKIPDKVLAMVESVCEIILHEEPAISQATLKQKIRNADGLMCLLTSTIDEEIFSAAPNLKVVSNIAVGYNNIDVAAASRRGIAVTNTPGVLTRTTADLTWALLTAVSRRVCEGDRIMRAGKFPGWDLLYLLGRDIHGKTLGILGAGRIGSEVAKRSTGWDMPILYYHRSPNPDIENRFGARRVSLEQLLRESDFVSIHLPLTPETHHLINRQTLRLMKPTAFLINTARGPIVDEAALVEALQHNRIAGAALDVFENEPKMQAGLAGLENVVLAPHIGSATIETRTAMARKAAENLLAALQGKQPPDIVNPEIYHNTGKTK